jgi:hypothetical protein
MKSIPSLTPRKQATKALACHICKKPFRIPSDPDSLEEGPLDVACERILNHIEREHPDKMRSIFAEYDEMDAQLARLDGNR